MSLDSIEGGGGSRKRCKSYQKRSMKTGHCRNVGSKSRRSGRGMMTRAMKRMHGGELIEGGEVEGGEVEVEGGGATRKPCKRGKTRRGSGVCHKPKSKSRSHSRSRKMRGGELIEGGEVEGGEVEGGEKPCKRGKTRKGTGVCHKTKTRTPCKRGKTRKSTGVCHKPKSKSRSRS